jgi:2-oxoisovalerate dehydrogenase E1 component
MALSREADRREGICFRQGKAWFELAGAGHEAIAAVACALRADDYVYPHYRDRALMLARGATVYDLALGFFAKAESSSGGRQYPSHFSDAERRAVSCASPAGIQCLPAAGTAWSCKRRGAGQITVCFIGDAAVRQGEFYEALSFALQERLPLVFLVEDNAYGVSTPTARMNPYGIGALAQSHMLRLDGRDPEEVLQAATGAVERARTHKGPSVLWLEVDRLFSHSSSDDQRLYRSAEEIAAMQERDPITRLRDRLIMQGEITAAEWEDELREIADAVDKEYTRAQAAADPSPSHAESHIYSPLPLPALTSGLAPKEDWTMIGAINTALRRLLADDERVLLFGEDIEDPKGGVFGLTKGLSTDFPGRVVNSPLAEATIAGLACGLAIAGDKPVFELQFIDFAGPAFHQIVSQIATLRWRTAGAWKCPLVLLAPCGAYLPAGGPWHSQTNESWFAHAPGLHIAMPSNVQDAAALLRAAVAGDDPVLLLLPKHLFRQRFEWRRSDLGGDPAVRLGEARVCREGSDVTVVSWGNCVELSLEAAQAMQSTGISTEVLDLRSIVPCDWETIRLSLAKTGRIVIVQEDNQTCSFGQAIVSEVVTRPCNWDLLAAPPQLVSRADVQVSFNVVLERAVLPQVSDICDAMRLVMSY